MGDETARIEAHYTRLIAEHGDRPEAAQWSNRETQEARFQKLVEVGDLRDSKVLDFGCGTGHLLTYLHAQPTGFTGQYVGIDLVEPALQLARGKFPGVRFERRDVLSDGLDESFDYVIANGVFNNRLADNWSFMTESLTVLYERARRAVAFNAMSRYVDYMTEDLWYVDPVEVFEHCKANLSPAVALLHDYQVKPGVIPFEFTIYVRRVTQRPVPKHPG